MRAFFFYVTFYISCLPYTPLNKLPTFPTHAASVISPTLAIPAIPVKEDVTPSQMQQFQVPNNAQLYNQMMMMQAQHQAQMHYMQQCIMQQQSHYNQQQYSGQYYAQGQGQYAPGFTQQYAAQPSAPQEPTQDASLPSTGQAPSSSASPTPAPTSQDSIPQLSSSPTEDPRSSSPVIFSNIISETSSVVTPSAIRPLRAPTTPSLSISSIPTISTSSFSIVGSEKDSPFIIKKMKEFKDFSPKEDHVRFWCKCDTCVFFAKNGVDIRLEGHMKYLIMDKKINFLSFFYRTRCKCGNNSKDCPVPPNKLSMFYSHKDDKDFNDPMVVLDWGKRCQRAHCWNPSCDRTHFPFTFRGDRKF